MTGLEGRWEASVCAAGDGLQCVRPQLDPAVFTKTTSRGHGVIVAPAASRAIGS